MTKKAGQAARTKPHSSKTAISSPAPPGHDAALYPGHDLRGNGAGAEEPLREQVRGALEHYFRHLDGHDPCGLFALVLQEVEAPLLESVMRHSDGNQSRAAQILGINRGTLRKKLRQYQIGQHQID